LGARMASALSNLLSSSPKLLSLEDSVHGRKTVEEQARSTKAEHNFSSASDCI